MTEPRNHVEQPELEERRIGVPAEDRLTLSRRAVMRRSMLGLTGIGLTALLAACDDEEEPAEDEEVVEEEPVEGEEVVEEEPVEEEEDEGL